MPYHEKKLGQLFCDNKSSDILEMLLRECAEAGAEILLDTSIEEIARDDDGYRLRTSAGEMRCESLVIASGGLSIPTLGASGFGYRWRASSATRCCRPAPGWCRSPSPTS